MKVVKYTAAAALLLSLGAGALTANAETKEYKSTGTLKLIQDTSITPPVDPVNPTDPVIPVDPPGPGTAGPLSIDFASNLDFGEQSISTVTETYHAKPTKVKDSEGETSDRPNYVQVTDKRGGQKGWTLSVKQSGQFATKDNADVEDGIELSGAQITLNNGAAVKAETSEATAPTIVKSEIILDAENASASTVMGAKVGEGGGTWINRFGDINNMADSISLKVPGGSLKEAATYNTELVWSIDSTPANEL
ncbi:WxL domain-containing protein [Kurthia sibirica]|uniref:Cell surface protein n=1 Tax=Kurthia sibirica TaxID=202750 RepID=A0A2U3ANQ9_9BACL|nr:WxL domain-containing protein [Kurthia sibirica]PWI26174.1 cell surface protein [Kurthia sibirica]GEK33434.1 hypothetical protein KSI01_09670 [Kurthia sibirica]